MGFRQSLTALLSRMQASGNGYHTVTLHNGIRDVYYARYLDWLVTTPLLLVDVLLICKLPLSSWFFAIFADVAMNLTGLFGGVLSGTYRYRPRGCTHPCLAGDCSQIPQCCCMTNSSPCTAVAAASCVLCSAMCLHK